MPPAPRNREACSPGMRYPRAECVLSAMAIPAAALCSIFLVLDFAGLQPYSFAGGGGGTKAVHGRSRMTIDPRIPTMLGRDDGVCVCDGSAAREHAVAGA